MTVTTITGRRTAIQTLGLGFAASAIGLVIERTTSAQAAVYSALIPQGAGQLNALMQRLAKAPRRRDFKSVPMILTALVKADVNPDKLSYDCLAAELTNHLVGGGVLIPDAAATMPELQQVGF